MKHFLIAAAKSPFFWIGMVGALAVWPAVGHRDALETDPRAACLEFVQDTLGRGVKPTNQQAWNAVTVNGTWLVEAVYTDRNSAGTLWCYLAETHQGFRRVSIHNRYMDALRAPLL